MKCDERPEGCANCTRLRLVCSGNPSASSEHLGRVQSLSSPPPTEPTIKRKRTYRSCINCRTSKIRCSGDKPSCSGCQQKKLRCHYEAGSTPAWAQRIGSVSSHTEDVNGAPNTATAQPTDRSVGHTEASPLEQGHGLSGIPNQPVGSATNPQEANPWENPSISWYSSKILPDWRKLTEYRLMSPDLPDAEQIRAVVGQYFENVHTLRCFAFIHKPSFMKRLDDDFASDHHRNAVFHVICALGAQ